MRHVGLFSVFLVVSGILGLVYAFPAQAQACQFVLGFAALRDLIPEQVGQCLENETHNPSNGDGLQRTSGGLLVWRKADNWTAFTDGVQTWINGPFGLQQRPNDQRFSWEQNPDGLPITPPPVAGDRCHTAGLTLTAGGGQVAVGHVGNILSFTNNLGVPCTFFGYVGAQLVDGQGNAMPTQVLRGGGYLFVDPGPTLVTVPPGGSAQFGLEWVHVPTGNETTCPVASVVQITPPDEFDSIGVPLQVDACDNGTLRVTAVFPPG